MCYQGFVKFYISTIYMLKLTRKLLIYLKSFYFVLWLIIIQKLRCYDKYRNHNNRANNFMRNNWDNRVKEIYDETNYIAYYKFYSLCTMPVSILSLYFCTLQKTITKLWWLIPIETFQFSQQLKQQLRIKMFNINYMFINFLFLYVIILHLDQYFDILRLDSILIQ